MGRSNRPPVTIMSSVPPNSSSSRPFETATPTGTATRVPSSESNMNGINSMSNHNRSSSSSLPRHSSHHTSTSNGNKGGATNDVDEEDNIIRHRISRYNTTMGSSNSNTTSKVTDPETAELVQCLATQSFHLPGNNWKQDWIQYICNNHPILGICCHHPLHPVKSCTRVVALLGTVIFGLALTNVFYLFFLWNPKFDQPILTAKYDTDTILDSNTDDGGDSSSSSSYTLTTGMLLLWTLGGGIHTAYNLAMWHMAACACCRPGGCCERMACCPNLGKRFLRVFVIIIVVWTAFIVILRVAITQQLNEDYENSGDSGLSRFLFSNGTNETDTVEVDGTGTNNPSHNPNDDKIHILDDDNLTIDLDDIQEFHFLLGYFIEMVLALLVYYPIGATVLFSGILGCGCIPIIGGRPYEVKVLERKRSRKLQRSSSAIKSIPVQHIIPPNDEEEQMEVVWAR